MGQKLRPATWNIEKGINTMELVFNELSLKNPFISTAIAQLKMEQMVLLIQELFSHHGVKNDLRVADDFLHLELSKDYKILKWLNDESVDRELKRFFKAKISRKPYIDMHTESHLYNSFISSEFIHNGVYCRGLGVAHLLDGIAISISSHLDWNTPILELTFLELDSSGELYEELLQIRHVSLSNHLELHKPYFELRKKLLIDDEDWRNRIEELFPALIFCERALAQLLEFRKGELILKQIKNRLFDLNEYFINWTRGAFNASEIPFKITPESQKTLDQYENDHKFLCPDGEYRIFTWHLRMTPGAGRIFFRPDEANRNCIIGHIGNKLKTVNDPT